MNKMHNSSSPEFSYSTSRDEKQKFSNNEVFNPFALSSSQVHPDLQKERKSATFDPAKLSVFLYGEKKLAKLAKLRKHLEHNLLFEARDLWWMSGAQRYMRACEQAEEFVRVLREHRLMDDEDYVSAMQVMAGEDFFVMLHITMFLPAIENMADEEQKKAWLPLAKDFRILGTYCQTELSHGSNVNGLETTADFDETTDEWVLRTPFLNATKWWPGGLAKSCTHCILMARLRIRDKDYGVHPFMLQVRDINTHETLPGIFLFHIGQKLGYNGMDNGGMQLNNVRIPRTNLLMRFNSVDRNGVYKKLGNEKLLWGTMTFTRKQIISAAGVHLAKSVVIATRYSAVRRQFPSMNEEIPAKAADLRNIPESQVLDYSTQQYVLFPLLAASIAYIIAGRYVDKLYNEFTEEARHNKFDKVKEMHIITSALKAVMALNVSNGIEMTRKACGGHGFMLAAGIPLHFASYVPQATYEGDFVVLSIQAGRALLKSVEKKMKGEYNSEDITLKFIYDFDPFAEYTPVKCNYNDYRDFSWQLNAYKMRACVLIYKAAATYAESISNGATVLKALDTVKIEFTRITAAYANLIILEQFQLAVESVKNDAALYEVLKDLCDLFALYWINESYGEFVVGRVLTHENYEGIYECIKNILLSLRKNCVTICDSFGFPDYLLNSALGRWDGRVYEALMKSTKYEPLNRYDIADAYYAHIQYILHPERKLPYRAKF